MPFHSWAPEGSLRHKWLLAQKDDYLLSLKNETLGEWHSDIYRRYFEKFHWSIPDSEDPDKHPKINVDDPSLSDEKRAELEVKCAQACDKKKKVRSLLNSRNSYCRFF
jgi:hypothetical protein